MELTPNSFSADKETNEYKSVKDTISAFRLGDEFYSEDYDPVLPLLKISPDVSMIKTRNDDLTIIECQLSRKIIEHYDAFVIAMENIQKLSVQLERSKELCSESRDKCKMRSFIWLLEVFKLSL